MRRLMLLIRNRFACLHHEYGREEGQLQVMQSILDEYNGEIKRMPKRVRRAYVAMEEA